MTENLVGGLIMKITEISRELVREGYTKKVDCKNYWDSHGKKIWDFVAPTQYAFDRLKKYELYRVKQLWESEYIKPMESEHLELFIEGKRLDDLGEITEFRELKTKLKLDCCVGAG